jgi:hypothetical protein
MATTSQAAARTSVSAISSACSPESGCDIRPASPQGDVDVRPSVRHEKWLVVVEGVRVLQAQGVLAR